MKVQLINYTQDALETMLLTKKARLTNGESLTIEDMKKLSMKEKLEELDYMLKTIKSSWEFVDYIFMIEGVSRAFTHQFVRTRTGTYAQQAQRVVNMSGFDYIVPENISEEAKSRFKLTMQMIAEGYEDLIEIDAVSPQDARGILPTNACTNIIAKFNLRTLSDMAEKRLCYRTQGEYQEVFKAIRNQVLSVHSWADKFIRVYCAAHGTCQFPNFKECPIKNTIFNPETGMCWNNSKLMRPDTLDEIQSNWGKTEFESAPKWNGNS